MATVESPKPKFYTKTLRLGSDSDSCDEVHVVEEEFISRNQPLIITIMAVNVANIEYNNYNVQC